MLFVGKYLLLLLIVILIFNIHLTFFFHTEILANKSNEYLLVLKNTSQILNNETFFTQFGNNLKQFGIIVTLNRDFGTMSMNTSNISIPTSPDNNLNKELILLFGSNISKTNELFRFGNDSIICTTLEHNPEIESCEPNLSLPPPDL